MFLYLQQTLQSTERKKKHLSRQIPFKLGIDYLKKYIQPNNAWQSENPEILRSVNGLIHFAEDGRIDTIVTRLANFQKKSDFHYITRLPQQVGDSLQVKGFQSYPTILEKMKQLDRAIWNGVDMKTIPLTENLTAGPDGKVPPIAEGDEEAIIRRTRIILPDSLKNVLAVQDSLGKAANNFDKIKNRQKARSFILEVARQRFNNKIEKNEP